MPDHLITHGSQYFDEQTPELTLLVPGGEFFTTFIQN
jgi:hypothetical protein